MNWSEGYHTEQLYTYGYYKENSPTLQRFAVLLAGYDIPQSNEHSVHMELGFGQGVSINIHAASQPGRYIGNDFNPNHVAYAQQLAQSAQTSVQLYDDSFAQMAAREDLPAVDSISLHGIWSWISDDNRQHIKTIIKRCLKPGGVVYNSYNSICGHAAFLPWRDMIVQYYQQQSGNSLQKLAATCDYFQQLFDSNPSLLEQNPVLKSAWERIKTSNQHYILHEYFNGCWNPSSLREMADDFAEVKLQFVGSTANNSYLDALHLEANRLKQLQAQPNALLYEQWRDLLFGGTFRQDLYIKGGLQLNQQQLLRRLQAYRFVATVNQEQFSSFLFSTDTGLRFNDDLFTAFVEDLFAEDAAPKSLQRLQDALPDAYNVNNLLQIILLKINAGQLHPCLAEASTEVKAQCRRLNQAVLQQLDDRMDAMALACPTSGMGIMLDWMQAWVVRDLLHDIKTDDATIAAHMWQALQNNNKLLLDDEGNTLQGEEAHINVLLDKVAAAKKRVGVWKALGIL